MEIVQSQRKPSVAVANVVSSLSLYQSHPFLEVRPEDFELFAIDRLRVLIGISDGVSRRLPPDEMERLVEDLLKAHMRLPHPSESKDKDIVSHFVLRLVYCRTDDLRKWFLNMETILFLYRFKGESLEAQKFLLAESGFPYEAISSAEYETVKEMLIKVALSLGQSATIGDPLFYKVPFEEVPELFSGRKVYLKKGYAYVAQHQVVSLVSRQFHSLLSKALTLTNRTWTSVIREQANDSPTTFDPERFDK